MQSNWNENDTTSKAYIQNKPTIPAAPNDGTLTIYSANGSTSIGSFTANQSTPSNVTVATPSDLPYGMTAMAFNGDDIAVAMDGSINIASSTPSSCTVKIPAPASGKVTDFIIQFDTSTTAPQITYQPINGTTTEAAENISWRNVSGDTMVTGSGKMYWVMIQMWNNATGSAKPYTGVMTIRELAAS